MANGKERFGSNLTFILALAGSAIGLGNIWRFPYIMGEYGGSAFIIVYLLCTFLISLPILLSETVIGLEGNGSPYYAFRNIVPSSKWKYAGLLAIAGSFIFVSYYSVVGGWSVDFFIRSLTGAVHTDSLGDAVGLFDRIVANPWESIISYTLFLALTAGIILMGVQKGIEKFTKYTIPILFVLMVGIMIYCLTLPGSAEGVRYLIEPDFSKLTPKAFVAAMGQSFFSMSVGVGMAITYSSYSSNRGRIVSAGIWTCVFDTLFAILAGFAVIPAVFAAGIEPSSGPSLVFSTLPYIFNSMEMSSRVIGLAVTTLFFVTILTAALSSSISMLETVVAHMIQKHKWSRLKSTLVISAGAWCIGILCALSFGVLSDVRICGDTIFSFCDHMSSNYVMVAGAFLFSVFVGWVMKKETVCSHIGPVFHFLIKWVVPEVILLIFVSNLL